ncbi:hypothetical protein OY671_010076, partial [Metschnikowia pulcherrima]
GPAVEEDRRHRGAGDHHRVARRYAEDHQPSGGVGPLWPLGDQRPCLQAAAVADHEVRSEQRLVRGVARRPGQGRGQWQGGRRRLRHRDLFAAAQSAGVARAGGCDHQPAPLQQHADRENRGREQPGDLRRRVRDRDAARSDRGADPQHVAAALRAPEREGKDRGQAEPGRESVPARGRAQRRLAA